MSQENKSSESEDKDQSKSDSSQDDGGADDLSYTERSEVAQDPPPTAVEWGARIFSVLVVLGLIAYVLVSGMQSGTPPDFELQIKTADIDPRGAAWVVPGTVRNIGDVSVADLVITLVVEGPDGEPVEEVDLSVPLLGHGAQKLGEFWIGSDPATHQLSLEVASYNVP